MVIRPGRAPIRSSGGYIRAALRILRSLGTNAHVWLPGANGVSVASLPSNNYLLSDGSTGYSTVDGVDGLTLDGMGAVSTVVSVPSTTVGSQASGNSIVGGSVAVVTGRAYTVSYIVTASVGVFSSSIGGTVNGAVKTDFTGTFSETLFATSSATVFVGVIARGAGITSFTGSVTVTETTGIHLVQPTTSNKCLVRKGMYGELIYSHTLSNAAWVTQFTASKSGSNLLIPADLDNLYQLTALPAGTYTFGVLMSGAGTVSLFGWTGAQGPFSITSYTLTSTPTLHALTLVSTGANLSVNIGRRAGSTATSVTLGGMGLFKGTWTAAQILAEGGLPVTTANPASNPNAGKYWWSFDGSNDSLLSGNLGITNACTIVIAGRVNSLAVNQALFDEGVGGVQWYIVTNGAIYFVKPGSGNLVSSATGAIVAGVPFVLTIRLSGGTAVIRSLGVQVATAASALTFAATTGARVGAVFDGLSGWINGAIGWVVPLPVALSDADCLTVERFVAAQFPNGPVF